jgi:hypothetical protein
MEEAWPPAAQVALMEKGVNWPQQSDCNHIAAIFALP